jgi:hypothetical protein
VQDAGDRRQLRHLFQEQEQGLRRRPAEIDGDGRERHEMDGAGLAADRRQVGLQQDQERARGLFHRAERAGQGLEILLRHAAAVLPRQMRRDLYPGHEQRLSGGLAERTGGGRQDGRRLPEELTTACPRRQT